VGLAAGAALAAGLSLPLRGRIGLPFPQQDSTTNKQVDGAESDVLVFQHTSCYKNSIRFMKKLKPSALARRERQIMDVLYKLQRATVAEVLNKLTDKPSYSTVRAQLRVLEEKGHVRHEEHGLRYVYVPTVPRDIARRSALRHLVETFFDGSAESVVAALLGGEVSRISKEELDRIAGIIAQERRET